MPLLVRVKDGMGENFIGWYGERRRRAGEIFELEKKEHFSGNRHLNDGTPSGIDFIGWMEWVNPPKEPKQPVDVPPPVIEAVKEVAEAEEL